MTIQPAQKKRVGWNTMGSNQFFEQTVRICAAAHSQENMENMVENKHTQMARSLYKIQIYIHS